MFRKLKEQLDRMMGRGVLDDEFYEELEEALLLADTSLPATEEILKELREVIRREKITTPEGIRDRLKKCISDRLNQGGDPRLATSPHGPTVYLFVGVNGAGKTTTIGKLAHRLHRQKKRAVLAAGDTFRAAAIDQLRIWSQRTGAEFVGSQPGGDSAAIIYDAVKSAESKGMDYVLADTAGRQHNKASLMTELAKIARATEKARGRGPDEVLLVLDANTGQNAIRQAEEFAGAAGVTGLVITKLDGTARGGALIGVWDRLKIPIKLMGLGEKPDDLRDFDPDYFSRQLLDDN